MTQNLLWRVDDDKSDKSQWWTHCLLHKQNTVFLTKGLFGAAILQTSHTLQWRHNDHDSVSNHQPHGCLLNRLFRCRSKKTSKLHVTGLCVGNSPGLVNSPHKGPVTRKMFPFDDVIMTIKIIKRVTLTQYWMMIKPRAVKLPLCQWGSRKYLGQPDSSEIYEIDTRKLHTKSICLSHLACGLSIHKCNKMTWHKIYCGGWMMINLISHNDELIVFYTNKILFF